MVQIKEELRENMARCGTPEEARALQKEIEAFLEEQPGDREVMMEAESIAMLASAGSRGAGGDASLANPFTDADVVDLHGTHNQKSHGKRRGGGAARSVVTPISIPKPGKVRLSRPKWQPEEAEDEEERAERSKNISDKVSIDKSAVHASDYEAAVDDIEQVHDVPPIPKVMLDEKHMPENGLYDPAKRQIWINPARDHRRLTTIHELGHYLDYNGLGRSIDSYERSYGSDYRGARLRGGGRGDRGPQGRVMDAIKESDAIKKIESMKVHPMDDGYFESNPGYLEYLLKNREKFARAYSQWIASRANDPELTRELKEQQQKIRDAGETGYPYVWEDEDFVPIAEAFDELFKERGWLKSPAA